jgi:hypothetical protein
VIRKKHAAHLPKTSLALRRLYELVTAYEQKMPQFVDMRPESFGEGVKLILAAEFPELFAPQDKEAVAQQRRDAEAAVQAALDVQRAETARAIVNAGRKARGQRPLDGKNIVAFNPKGKNK